MDPLHVLRFGLRAVVFLAACLPSALHAQSKAKQREWNALYRECADRGRQPAPLTVNEETRLVAAAREGAPWWVQAQIMSALGYGNTASSLEALRAALRDPRPEVAAKACASLGARQDSASAPQMLELFRSGSLRGPYTPLGALARIGGPFAHEAALEGLISPSAIERKEALDILGREAREANLPLIAPLLDDPEERVRTQALWAAANSGPAGIAAAMESLTRLDFCCEEQECPANKTLAFHTLHILLLPGLLSHPAAREWCERQTTSADSGRPTPPLCACATGMGGRIPGFYGEGSGDTHRYFYSTDSPLARTVPHGKGSVDAWLTAPWEKEMAARWGAKRVQVEPGFTGVVFDAHIENGVVWLNVVTGPYSMSAWIPEDRLAPVRAAAGGPQTEGGSENTQGVE